MNEYKLTTQQARLSILKIFSDDALKDGEAILLLKEKDLWTIVSKGQPIAEVKGEKPTQRG